MIESLNSLTERAIRDLSGGDIPADSPYEPEFVKRHLRDAINEDLKVELLRRKQGGDDDRSMPTQMIATYIVAVTFDDVTRQCKIALPTYFLSLKHNKGIHAVSTIKHSLKRFIPVAQPGIASQLRHFNHYNGGKNDIPYYTEGMEVIPMRNIYNDGIKHVLVKLLIGAPSTIDDDTPLPLLPESIGRVLDLAKARTLNKYPQDRIADGNPNIRQVNEQAR